MNSEQRLSEIAKRCVFGSSSCPSDDAWQEAQRDRRWLVDQFQLFQAQEAAKQLGSNAPALKEAIQMLYATAGRVLVAANAPIRNPLYLREVAHACRAIAAKLSADQNLPENRSIPDLPKTCTQDSTSDAGKTEVGSQQVGREVLSSDLVVGPAMLRETVEWLANTNMHADMIDWDLHSNRILAAANQLEQLQADPNSVCNCGALPRVKAETKCVHGFGPRDCMIEECPNYLRPSKERVSQQHLKDLREMSALVAVKGALLIQLIDEIEERRASETPAQRIWNDEAQQYAAQFVRSDSPAEKTPETPPEQPHGLALCAQTFAEAWIPGYKPSPGVQAGNAFFTTFKREPTSATDCAWLNGYAAAIEQPSGEMAPQSANTEFASNQAYIDWFTRYGQSANTWIAWQAAVAWVRKSDQTPAALTHCPYCNQPADKYGILHMATCEGLKSVELNRLQYDNLLAARRAEKTPATPVCVFSDGCHYQPNCSGQCQGPL
jgi:hypothetical protein